MNKLFKSSFSKTFIILGAIGFQIPNVLAGESTVFAQCIPKLAESPVRPGPKSGPSVSQSSNTDAAFKQCLQICQSQIPIGSSLVRPMVGSANASASQCNNPASVGCYCVYYKQTR